jgi:hypothetical protein
MRHLWVLGIVACASVADHPSMTYSFRPHCGEELTVTATPNRVEWRGDHNCGGPNSRGGRNITPDEWAELMNVARREAMESLPAEIEHPHDSAGNITVVTDDSRECVTSSQAGRHHEVCGWSLALSQSADGERVLAVAQAIKRLAARTAS